MKPIPIQFKMLKLASVMAAALLAVSFVMAAAGPAYAQSTGPTPSTATVQPGALRNDALERAYSREKDWLAVQAINMERLNSASQRVQSLITAAQGKGWDTSALQAAMNSFKAQISQAQTIHETAAGILAGHAGFDANGKVTDAAAAHQTLVDARQSLDRAHLMIRQAVIDLRNALRAFREAHRGSRTASPAPTE